MKNLYVSLLLVFAAIALAGFIFWRYFYLSTITIEPTPSDATITVNGQPTPDRTLRLPRGSYTVKVSADGYRSETFTVKTGIGSLVNKKVILVSLPKPHKILDGPINSLVVSADHKTFFFEKSGVLYYMPLSPAGAPAAPITPQLQNIQSVDWSPDFSLALLHKTNGEVGLYDFNRYDLLHQEYRPLPATVKSTVWANDNSGFFYIKQDDATGEFSIAKADRTGKEIERLFDLATPQRFPRDNPKLISGPGTTLFLTGENKATRVSDVYIFDTYQKVIPAAITDSGRISGLVTSSDKTNLAYLDNGELVVSEPTGKNKRNLTLRPQPGNYSFIDNNTLAVLTQNQVTLVDLAKNSQKSLEVYAPNDTISSLIADPDGKNLYYTYLGNLYLLNAKEQ